LTWAFPAVGPGMEILKAIAPASFPPRTSAVAYLSISYIIGVLVSAFLVKRGIMLGGIGMDACYPGFLSGRGGYEEEKHLLNAFHCNASEFPLDIVLYIGSALLSLFLLFNATTRKIILFNPSGMIGAAYLEQIQVIRLTVTYVILCLIYAGALLRRTKLGRT
jgi:hypothetical protein